MTFSEFAMMIQLIITITYFIDWVITNIKEK